MPKKGYNYTIKITHQAHIKLVWHIYSTPNHFNYQYPYIKLSATVTSRKGVYHFPKIQNDPKTLLEKPEASILVSGLILFRFNCF